MRRVVLLCLAIVACGCAESEPAVDRVQPNALDKSTFQGAWYYLQTVIDTPYSAEFTFVGEQSVLEKIEWDIQEDVLVARRSYEHIAGSEGEGIRGETTDHGAPIAMWAIESHFDIRREYNAVTGEEENIVVENTTDRPWYERQFMRVDWSKNLITDTQLFMYARLFDGIRTEPVAYYVQHPHPDAPKFVRNAESGQIDYIDIVNKMFVEPQSVWIDGWGEIPVCWLFGNEHLDCTSSEVGVRNAFMRVGERDYQPFDYTGDRMEKFGYFVTTRAGFDPDYGVVDPVRYRFANRFDLWEKSHRVDASGAQIACSSDADCDDGRGSVCDLDLAKARRSTQGACTIAYRDRAVRPVAYYVSKNLPGDLFNDAKHVTDDWGRALHDTIASLRETECMTWGGDAASCAGERDRDDAAAPFVLCHNPVREGEPASCGAADTVAEIGDLRFNMLGWVHDPSPANPLGYGPSAADPETGELVQSNAFLYGAEVDELAAYARDLVMLLDGALDVDDIADGDHVREWAASIVAGGERSHAVDVDGADASRIAAAMDFSWARPSATELARRTGRPRNLRELRDRMRAADRRIASSGGYGHGGSDAVAARLGALAGTPIEQRLTGEELRIAAGVDPRLPVDAHTIDASSPLRGMSLARRRALENARRRMRAERCVLGRDFIEDGLLGLARAIRKAVDEGDGTMEWYGVTYTIRGEDGLFDWDAVRDMLRHPIFEATAAHEVGHTLGLRHNFSGSYDSVNYGPEYWALRDDGHMQPRAWDPLTTAEIDGRIREHQTSSVMDYGQNFVATDSAGIGHYDRAAIKMGYGDLVEVFTNASDARTISWINVSQQWGYSIWLNEDSFYAGEPITAHPYTALPALLGGGVERIEERADVPYRSLVAERGLAGDGIDVPVVDAAGRPAVPYRFCSDEQSDLDPSCSLYDAGADAYESLQSIIDAYWQYYALNAFRRGRIGFEVDPYYWRIYDRYFVKLQAANQMYALDRSWYEDVWAGEPSLDEFWTRPDGYGAWTLGIGAAYQLLSRVVAAPEPGSYVSSVRPDGSSALVLDDFAESPDAVVGIDDGRFLETTWDFDHAGYYWFDQLARVGFFYDKVLALQVLTDPETFFVGKDTASDARGYALSFHTTFAPSLTGLMRGLMSDDWSFIGPRAQPDGKLRWPDPLELATGGAAGVPIDPNASFSVQLYAAVFGMALIPLSYDNEYLHSARIWVRGGAEAVTPSAGTVTTEFTDPVSGLTYVAVSYTDGTAAERGIGARMIGHANALAAAGADAEGELDLYVDNLDVARGLSWYLGWGGI